MKAIAMGLILAGATAAQAGTNFPPLADYPAPNCAKSEKPNDVPPMKNGEDPVAYNKRIKQHNQQVVQYNADLHQYTACMNEYVTNAQADMNFIRDKVNKAVAASNPTPSSPTP
jgi:hypothetical protein